MKLKQVANTAESLCCPVHLTQYDTLWLPWQPVFVCERVMPNGCRCKAMHGAALLKPESRHGVKRAHPHLPGDKGAISAEFTFVLKRWHLESRRRIVLKTSQQPLSHSLELNKVNYSRVMCSHSSVTWFHVALTSFDSFTPSLQRWFPSLARLSLTWGKEDIWLELESLNSQLCVTLRGTFQLRWEKGK